MSRQVKNVWEELSIKSTTGTVCCSICEKCAVGDIDGEELGPWFTQRVVGFHSRMMVGGVEKYVHVCGRCMEGQWAMVGPDSNVTVVVLGMECVKRGTEHILWSYEHSIS
jgi:hypothetical protein